MTNHFFTVFTLCLFAFTGTSQQVEKDTFRLFYLGGQSNMVGYGTNADLPESLAADLNDVWIFHGHDEPDEKLNGGQGIWEIMKPGHGKGFSSDGKSNTHSDRFGPELSFAKKIKELYPNDKIAIIKYARSGSSIDSTAARHFGSWEPDYIGKTGINQYDHFLTTLANALDINDIDKNGKIDKLIPSGIIWMQGESDARDEAVARRYFSNLKRLMDLMRAALLKDDLPIVLGKISDSGNNEEGKIWQYGELVQFAQEKLARTDHHTALVRSTRFYNYSDRFHYDSKGYIDLGEKFAQAIFLLNRK